MTVTKEIKMPFEKPTSIALGRFDGIHIGHRQVIEKAVSTCKTGEVPAVFTFEESPAKVLTGKTVPMLITPQKQLDLLAEMGIQQVFAVPFSSVKDLSAQEFVSKVLVASCNAKQVTCGFNFHFGKGGQAGVTELQKYCEEFGVTVNVVPEITIDGKQVSSTQIRGLLELGKIEEAAVALGRNFSFAFEVVHGNAIGRTMGIPTMNQPFPSDFATPKHGVYATRVRLDEEWLFAVSNIWLKPVEAGQPALVAETWIPNFQADLYGLSPEVELVSFIREGKKFKNLAELKAVILTDKEKAFKILNSRYSK